MPKTSNKQRSAPPAPRTKLSRPQMEIYRAGWVPEARFRTAVCGRRFGKALALDTPLPTPSGWTTMGDVQEGDTLFDEDGAPCTVTLATSVMHDRPCFRITFSDGSTVVADEEHLWLTWDRCARKNAARNARKVRVRLGAPGPVNDRPKVRTTGEILATLSSGSRGDTNHSVQTCLPVQCPEADLPIPPYVLGAWLGDGTTVNATFTCHDKDVQIIEEIHREGEEACKGKTVSLWSLGCYRDDAPGRASRYRAPLVKRLRDLGVLGNKHVPAVYMRASVAQRLALLQGLMDTDGTVSALGHCDFTSTDHGLALAALEIARSLGIRASIGEGVAKLNGRVIGPKWRVTFTTELPVFRLERKLARLQARIGSARNIDHRFIVSVEPVASVPVRCIQVSSPNRLYLCGEAFIPTHNTHLAVEEMRRACREAVRRSISVDNEIWYGSPTFKQAKRVFWRKLKRGIPPEWISGKPNETECSITLTSGHVIRCVGLDAYDNLRGSGLWFFLGDEWQDAPPEAWTETIRPMLSTAGGHGCFIGTPKGFNDLHEKFLAGQGGEPDWKSWTFTTLQGGNVPDDEVAAARRNLDARTFRQEYEASFESYEGRVLYAFSRAESVRARAIDLQQPIALGLDFNVNPMSASVWQTDAGVDYQVDEIIIPTSNTDEMVSEIRRRYARGGSLAHVTAYPDPAGAQRRTSAQGRTDISILRESGMQVLAMSSHPLVRDRINITNGRFLAADGTRRAFVDPRCVKSIEAYERLAYKEGTSDPDKSGGFDHLVDGAGYFLFGKYAYKPPRMATVPGLFQR